MQTNLGVFALLNEINSKKFKSPIWKVEKQKFIDVVLSKESFTEILNHFGLKMHGGNNNTLKRRIEYEGIDISHIINSRKKKNKLQLNLLHENNKRSLEEVLVKNSTYNNNYHLKIRLLDDGLLKDECYECRINSSWNGKPLSLQLDHINGDKTDNRLCNLRLLCPNCHSQTKNFSGKSLRKYYKCSDCGKNITRSSKSRKCISCINRSYRKTKNYPSKEELTKLILTKPFLQIGKDFGVSDNAIRKWCKSYDLPYRKKDIELQREQLEHMTEKELILT